MDKGLAVEERAHYHIWIGVPELPYTVPWFDRDPGSILYSEEIKK